MTDVTAKASWYAVHTYSGYEKKVQDAIVKRAESMNMEDFLLRCVVPEEKITEIKDGARRDVVRKLYPGYVFVEMIMTDESWYIVRNTTGVTGFVGTGNKPVSLLDEEVAPLLRTIGEEVPQVAFSSSVGDLVRILEKSFAGFTGTIVSIDNEKRKVKVSVPMFGGRETSLELDFDQVHSV